jgi:hypothetical protein
LLLLAGHGLVCHHPVIANADVPLREGSVAHHLKADSLHHSGVPQAASTACKAKRKRVVGRQGAFMVDTVLLPLLPPTQDLNILCWLLRKRVCNALTNNSPQHACNTCAGICTWLGGRWPPSCPQPLSAASEIYALPAEQELGATRPQRCSHLDRSEGDAPSCSHAVLEQAGQTSRTLAKEENIVTYGC